MICDLEGNTQSCDGDPVKTQVPLTLILNSSY